MNGPSKRLVLTGLLSVLLLDKKTETETNKDWLFGLCWSWSWLVVVQLGSSLLPVLRTGLSSTNQLPMHPNCNVSSCSNGNTFIPVTFANAGLIKLPVLPVSIMMYALPSIDLCLDGHASAHFWSNPRVGALHSFFSCIFHIHCIPESSRPIRFLTFPFYLDGSHLYIQVFCWIVIVDGNQYVWCRYHYAVVVHNYFTPG